MACWWKSLSEYIVNMGIVRDILPFICCGKVLKWGRHFCAIPDLIVTNECGFNVYIRKHNFTRVATNCLDNCYVSYEK